MSAAIYTGRIAPAATQSPAKAAQTQRQPAANKPIKTPAAIKAAIAKLAAGQWRTRHNAQQYLLLHGRKYLPQLLAALQKTANQEQAGRLENIALQFYLIRHCPSDGPVPFIGISFMLQPTRLNIRHHRGIINAAVVEQLLPGFYAARVLEPGDLIVAIEHRWLTAASVADDFRSAVRRYPPGKFIMLTVLRRSRLLHIHVRLHGMPADPAAQQNDLNRREALMQRFYTQYRK